MAKGKIRSCRLYNRVQNEERRVIDPEKLIEVVKLHRVLYDRNHSKWNNKWYKQKVWIQIGEQLERSARSCRVHWSRICYFHKQYLVSKVLKTSQCCPVKEYKYSSMLDFLGYDGECLLQSRSSKIITKLRANSGIKEEKEMDNFTLEDFYSQKKTPRKKRVTGRRRRVSEWKRDVDDEKLVELVRPHIVLYDKSHCRWKEQDYKKEIWKQIGAELDVPFMQCKRRWYTLLCNYKHYLTRRAKGFIKNHTPAELKYNRLLNFMGLENSSLLNINNSEIKGECFTDSDIEEIESDTQENEGCSETGNGTRSSMDFSERKITTEVKEPRNGTPQFMPFVPKNIEPVEIFAETHPIDDFISGITPTLQSLTSNYLKRAKTRIASLVREYTQQSMAAEKRSPIMKNI